jgi:hypothetical protein
VREYSTQVVEDLSLSLSEFSSDESGESIETMTHLNEYSTTIKFDSDGKYSGVLQIPNHLSEIYAEVEGKGILTIPVNRSGMKKIILVLFVAVFANAELTKSGNIVSDSDSGLSWQDYIAVTLNSMNWDDAVEYCEDLTLDVYSDCRLPNRNELLSIVDRSKYNPAIRDGFENMAYNSYGSARAYWSNSTSTDSSRDAWTVHFHNGNSYSNDKNYNNEYNRKYVRCVRG